MHAEIIAIGDEITSGQLLDTNTQWLSIRLEALGVRVLYHTTVGDQFAAMTDVFRRALERSDVVVATGGLGPTADDLTREAIAQATGRELVLDERVLDWIERLFARRRRAMPARNKVQAMFPRGSRVIENPNGTAPGIAMTWPRVGQTDSYLFTLPGVPSEMGPMWYETVAGELQKLGSGRRMIVHRQIKCFGAGESQVESMLPDLTRRDRVPRVGITASKASIVLRITAEGESEQACLEATEPTVAIIRERLGSLVFGEADDELEHVVVKLLHERQKTLATAEWGTAGRIADMLGAVSNSERVYLGGMVISSQKALTGALGLSADLVNRHAPTSEPIVRAMAKACRLRFQAELALAVGKFPTYDPEASKPEQMYVALANSSDVIVKSFPYAGNPALLKDFSAKRVFNVFRLAMMEDKT